MRNMNRMTSSTWELGSRINGDSNLPLVEAFVCLDPGTELPASED